MVNPKEQTNKQNLTILQFERDRLAKKINILHDLSIQVHSDKSICTKFTSRFSNLETIYQDFIKTQNDIIKLSVAIDPETDLKPIQDAFDAVDEQYYAILATQHEVLATEQSNTSPSLSDNQQSNVPQVRLPKLQLPTFNGLIKDWPHFKDLFSSLIHDNTSISDIQKFQYLLSCLTDEPHNLARTLPVTAQNYPIVWEQLVSRYDDKRRLATYYLDEILNLPSINNESPKQLRQLLDICSENSTALTNIEFPTNLGDFILLQCVVQKLDKRSRQLFESKFSKSEFPTFQNLLDFLHEHCKSLDAALLATDQKNQTQSKPNANQVSFKPQLVKSNRDRKQYSGSFNNQSKTVMLSNQPELKCDFCQKLGHKIHHCRDFESLTADKRLEFAKGKFLCTNCLRSDHKHFNCKSKHLCFKCKRKHHTLLHLESKVYQPTSITTSSTINGCVAAINPNTDPPQELCNTVSTNSTVILGTTLVSLFNTHGQQLCCRAVLDSAASSSFITTNIADKLGLKRNFVNLPQVCGISSTKVNVKGSSYVNIATVNGENFAVNHPVIVLDKITTHLPRVQICPKVKLLLRNHILADPSFDTPASIDLLIGADLFAQTLIGNQVTLGKDLPIALNTIFGYVIIGQAPSISSSPETSLSNISTNMLCTHDLDLHNSIQKFWINEEPPHFTKPSKEEEQCEQFFKDTHYRDATGRYVVRLPFKENPTSLGDSSTCALKQFKSMEKNLQSKPEMKKKYIEFMNDYKESGHMSICDEIPSGSNFYLPHHGVFKGEKIRVVFNASATTTNNVSLNDILHSGTKLHNNIFDIMFNFRRYKVVFSCDIKQMFRQINIDPSDRKYQLIYWREHPSQALSVYELNTVTYGMSCSPYLANRVVQQLIDDEEHNYQDLAPMLRQQIYVDDILLGSDSVSQALELQNDLISLLSKGGFELRKWISSHEELLTHLPPEHCETTKRFSQSDHLNDASPQLFSILGLKWLRDKDCFSYDIDIVSSSFTKRGVLSQIAKIYDIMGFLTPVVMWAKSFMQVIWSKGVTWDEPLPLEICEKWTNFVENLPSVRKVQIPRHIHFYYSENIQLHGFCDASQLGYGCCVYLRCENNNGTTTTYLLFAKSRVAPLKQISLPRLELCGAHLLSKLLRYCFEQLSPNYEINMVRAWCDSTITISWIQTPSYKLKTYVANRVTEIQENVPTEIWHYVPSLHNPADCASRGLLPHEIVDNSLWWNGPTWLSSPQSEWPLSSFSTLPLETLPDLKPASSTLLHTMLADDSLFFVLLSRFSSWTKLRHVVAYILRFISNCQYKIKMKRTQNQKVQPQTSENATPLQLSLKEIDQATTKILHYVQEDAFPNEIAKLKRRQMTTASALQKLSPFLDNKGLIRVGGRLSNSNLQFNNKHPILLPKKHTVTILIINYYHKMYLHCGPQQLQYLINSKYWILSARSIIRSQIFKCIQCFRNKPPTSSAFMGDLPAKRVTPTRPFLISGVDYAGPIMIKLHSLRRIQPIKIYLCVFICFTTKAVHLEIVMDLTSQAFIAALTRFISRRGMIKEIHSDNATNFIGAARVLRTTFDNIVSQEETAKFFKEHSIEFCFIPPRAPHHGGLWERAIQSAKFHLRRVIGNQILTLEEFSTLIARVEAMLNSRPLTPISNDPADLEAITPGHFLVGGPLVTLPEECLQNIETNRLKRWQLVQAFSQNIWKRWNKEYLMTLQQRNKWTQQKPNIKVEDMVVVHEENTPPIHWKLGRVISTMPGKDDVVRVVQIKTQEGIITRPIVKLSRLPDSSAF